MTFDPMSVEVTCVTLPKDHCVQVPWQYINVRGYSDQFCKIPHTYTYILHTYYVQNEWSHSLLLNSVQARQLLNSVQARQKLKVGIYIRHFDKLFPLCYYYIQAVSLSHWFDINAAVQSSVKSVCKQVACEKNRLTLYINNNFPLINMQ